MLSWLTANLVNLVIVAVLVLAVGLAIRSMIRDRKAGKCSCGGNCSSCGACSGGCAGTGNDVPVGGKKEPHKGSEK